MYMINKIVRPVNYIIKRNLHDRKLSDVKTIKKTNTKLIGTDSPKKAENNLNKEIYKYNNLKYEDYIKLRK